MIVGWGGGDLKDHGPAVSARCPNCRNETAFHYVTRTKKFSLYFIPLFPYSRRHYLLCRVCRYGEEIRGDRLEQIKAMTDGGWLNAGALPGISPTLGSPPAVAPRGAAEDDEESESDGRISTIGTFLVEESEVDFLSPGETIEIDASGQDVDIDNTLLPVSTLGADAPDRYVLRLTFGGRPLAQLNWCDEGANAQEVTAAIAGLRGAGE